MIKLPVECSDMVDEDNLTSGTGFVLSWKALVGGEIDFLEICRGLQEHNPRVHPAAEIRDCDKTHRTGMEYTQDLWVLQDM